MSSNVNEPNIEKPCTECFVTAMEADLEDEEGRSLNADTGAWLHREFTIPSFVWKWGRRVK